MEERTCSRSLNWLAAVLFVMLPLISLLSYVLLLNYPLSTYVNFSIYLLFLRACAYILLAVALIRAKKDTLFLLSFTLPVAISAVYLILRSQTLWGVLDLLTFSSLYFVALGANGYLPGCRKIAKYLCLLPGILGAISQCSSFPLSLMGIVYLLCYVFALFVIGIWALDQTRQEATIPPAPVTKIAGMGLITFGCLFLISKAVDVTLHYFSVTQFWNNIGANVPFTCENYLGASAIELLLYVIAGICIIYCGILLFYSKLSKNK
jgi:hypothetical protein